MKWSILSPNITWDITKHLIVYFSNVDIISIPNAFCIRFLWRMDLDLRMYAGHVILVFVEHFIIILSGRIVNRSRAKHMFIKIGTKLFYFTMLFQSNKTKSLIDVCLCILRSLKLCKGFLRSFLIDRVKRGRFICIIHL